MTFELMELPYALDALEPHLSKQEVDLHYNKHHHSYVKNLNKLVKGTEFEKKDLEYIIQNSSSGPIFNNAAQIYNHDLYWASMTPNSKLDKESKLGKAIIKEYNSQEEFQKKFKESATKLFGSGWVYVVQKYGELKIVQCKNAMTPLADEEGGHILFNCDVWEHGYLYMDKYFADRPAYIDGFIKLINWKYAEDQYIKATK